MFTLAQTLGGSWVITLPNPEERGWSTQLAEFDTTVTGEGSAGFQALESGAAATLAAFARALPERGHQVTSHCPAAKARMERLVELALA